MLKTHQLYDAAGELLLSDGTAPLIAFPLFRYFKPKLKRHNLCGNMSAKGCCYDNACVESFFHSLKVECIHGEHFINREIMRTSVFNYIECVYNLWRRHSACGGHSPEQFENQNLA